VQDAPPEAEADAAPPPARDDRPLDPRLAAALVFLASGAVLVLEILGVRLLAPYVGLTLEVTTSIIGAVLAGIALGSALGGRAADRTDPRRLLPGLLVAGGLLALLTVPLVRTLGPGARGGGDTAAFAVTLLALLPPAAVLSAVTPAVARLQLADLRARGTVVGSLSAWATGGALAGTFGTGFVLVPLLPVSVAVLAVGGVLLAAGLALGLRAGTTSRRGAGGLLAGAVLVGLVTVAAGSPCARETAYHCADVVEDRGARVLVLDDLRHSAVHLDDPRRLDFDYVRWIGDAIDGLRPAGAPLDAVYVGGGGFTLPRYTAAVRPGSTGHVLEVDGGARGPRPRRARPAHRARPAGDRGRRPGDAALPAGGVRGPDRGDAFGSRAVPWHLATAEWIADVRRVLRPGGLLAVNVIDQPPLGLLRAQAATLLDQFADVRLVVPPGPAGGNLVLLAADRPLPPGAGSSARGARTLDRAAVARFAAGADVLRDDDAPADQLLSPRR
jgi:MFS family permease